MTSEVATTIINHILENIFDKIDMSVNDQTSCPMTVLVLIIQREAGIR